MPLGVVSNEDVGFQDKPFDRCGCERHEPEARQGVRDLDAHRPRGGGLSRRDQADLPDHVQPVRRRRRYVVGADRDQRRGRRRLPDRVQPRPRVAPGRRPGRDDLRLVRQRQRDRGGLADPDGQVSCRRGLHGGRGMDGAGDRLGPRRRRAHRPERRGLSRRRANAFRRTAIGCPRPSRSPTRSTTQGRVYIVWADFRNNTNPGCTGWAMTASSPCDNDVFYSYSMDEGETWSEPIVITPRSDARFGESAQWQPWSQVTADGSRLFVAFYDRSYGNCESSGCNDITLAEVDDPASDSPTFEYSRVTTASMPNMTAAENPIEAGFLGDRMSLALDAQGRAHVTWADTRQHAGAVPEVDVYYARSPQLALLLRLHLLRRRLLLRPRPPRLRLLHPLRHLHLHHHRRLPRAASFPGSSVVRSRRRALRSGGLIAASGGSACTLPRPQGSRDRTVEEAALPPSSWSEDRAGRQLGTQGSLALRHRMHARAVAQCRAVRDVHEHLVAVSAFVAERDLARPTSPLPGDF